MEKMYHLKRDIIYIFKMLLFVMKVVLLKDLANFQVTCSCGETSNQNIAKDILENPLSDEVFGFISQTNLAVLTCIEKAFIIEAIFKNFGGLIMLIIYLVQIGISIFIKFQIKIVRSHIYSIINELSFPPKRINFSNETNENNNNNKIIKVKRDLSLENKKDNANHNNSTIKVNNNKELNVLSVSQLGPKFFSDDEQSNDKSENEKRIKTSESNQSSILNIKYVNKGLNESKEDEENKEIDIDIYKKKIKNNLVGEVKRELMLEKIIKEEKEGRFLHFIPKDYDEKELNEL